MGDERILEFNTGRYYSPKGQRIAAMEVNGPFDLLDFDSILDFDSKQYVIFVDKDRMISGKISWCEFTEEGIMRNYDKGNYEYIPREAHELENKLNNTFK